MKEEQKSLYLSETLRDLSANGNVRVRGSSKTASLSAAVALGVALSACAPQSAKTHGIHITAELSVDEKIEFVLSEKGLQAFSNPKLESTLFLEEGTPGSNPLASARFVGETLQERAGRAGFALNTQPDEFRESLGAAVGGGAAVVKVGTRAVEGGLEGPYFAGIYGNLDHLSNTRELGAAMSGFYALTYAPDYAGDRLRREDGSDLSPRALAAFVMLHEYRHSYNLFDRHPDPEVSVLGQEIDSDRAALNQFRALFGEADARLVGDWVVAHRALSAGNEALGQAVMTVGDQPHEEYFFLRGERSHLTSLGIARLEGEAEWSTEGSQFLAGRTLDAIDALSQKFIAVGINRLGDQFADARDSIRKDDPYYLVHSSLEDIQEDERRQTRFLYAASRIIETDAKLTAGDPDARLLASQIARGIEGVFPGIAREASRNIPELVDIAHREERSEAARESGTTARSSSANIDANRRASHVEKLLDAIKVRQEYQAERESRKESRARDRES